MRIKSNAIGVLEMIGDITEIKQVDDWLIMHVRTTTPVGWDLRAALNTQDLRLLIKLLLKPRNLKYLVLGLVRPLGNTPPPEY